MKNVSLHELQLLTGTNYQVLTQLLASVPLTRGPNRAHIYNSVDALRAIYSVSPTTLEQARLRTEMLNQVEGNRAGQKDSRANSG